MDFASLQVFKAVVDEGGITQAAKKLHRVQSNVTTRIQQLEASLGAQLFVRTNRRLHLSPAGELFLGYVDELLRLSDRAKSAVSGDAPQGVLRIGSLESTVASRLPVLLSRYHQRFPRVRIELTTGTNDALIEAVLTRKVEAAFTAECSEKTELEVLPAFKEQLCIIATTAHAKIRRPRDVRGDTVIAFPAGCAYRRKLQAWLATDGVVPERTLELASYHAIVSCVAAGTGIAFVPRSVLESFRGIAQIATYDLPAATSKVTTPLIWRKGESSLALNALRALVADNAKQRT
jgi:DNA-binding transcriptional LysR family regulator